MRKQLMWWNHKWQIAACRMQQIQKHTSLRWHCGADRLHVAFSELTETGSVECKNSLFNIKCLGKIIYHLFIYHSYTSNS